MKGNMCLVDIWTLSVGHNLKVVLVHELWIDAIVRITRVWKIQNLRATALRWTNQDLRATTLGRIKSKFAVNTCTCNCTPLWVHISLHTQQSAMHFTHWPNWRHCKCRFGDSKSSNWWNIIMWDCLTETSHLWKLCQGAELGATTSVFPFNQRMVSRQ